MAKNSNQHNLQELFSATDIKIEVFNPPNASDFVRDFIEARDRGDKEAKGTLAEYVKQKHYADKNVVVVPNLSGAHFEGFDIENVDFTGCNLKGASFQMISLKGSKFNDADLSEVSFYQADLGKVDMRGADLSRVKFAGYEQGGVVIDDKGNKLAPSEFLQGIKLSSHQGLIDSYIAENDRIRLNYYNNNIEKNTADAKKALDDNNKEIEKIRRNLEDPVKDDKSHPSLFANHQEAKRKADEKYATLTYNEAYGTGGENYEEYKKLYYAWLELEKEMQEARRRKEKLEQENNDINSKLASDNDILKALRDSKTPSDDKNIPYNVDPSLIDVMRGSVEFDPAYIRGSNIEQQKQEKQYIPFDRATVEEYLKARKTSPELSINDYAKTVMANQEIEYSTGAKVVADLSPRINENGDVVRVDISGLDFSGANLQESCFTGVDARKAKFNGANLESAVFEGAVLNDADFTKAIARDANFYHAYLNTATIEGADFSRSYMRASNARGVKISDSNFNRSDVRNGDWEDSVLKSSEFNNSDLEGVSLARADLERVQMRNAILNRALMSHAKIIESDFQNAYMQEAQVQEAEIKKTVLTGVQAQDIDLSDSELDKFVKMDEANLNGAILNHLNANGASFKAAKMNEVDAKYADFKGAQLEGIEARFSNFHAAVLEQAKMNKADISGANMSDVKAAELEFQNGIARDIDARRANFADANFTEADIQGSDFRSAFLQRIEAHKAQMQNVDLSNADARDGNFDGAKVNAGTKMHTANTEGAKGDLTNIRSDGTEEKISIEEQQRRSAETERSKDIDSVGKFFGSVLKSMGSGIKTAGEFVLSPFAGHPKTAMLVGAAIATVIIAPVVFATAPIAAPLIASLGVGAAAAPAVAFAGAAVISAIGAAAGAAAGYFALDKLELTTIAAAAAGAATVPFAPVAGAGLGAVLMGGFNRVTERLFGGTLGQGVKYVADKVGEGLENLGANIGLNEEQAELVKEHKAAVDGHQKVEKEQKLYRDGPNIGNVRMENQVKAQQLRGKVESKESQQTVAEAAPAAQPEKNTAQEVDKKAEKKTSFVKREMERRGDKVLTAMGLKKGGQSKAEKIKEERANKRGASKERGAS